MTRLDRDEALSAASCPICGEVVLDVDGIASGHVGLLQMIADMVGHAQVEHPHLADVFVQQAVDLGVIDPPRLVE